MAKQLSLLSVFVASPSDVLQEREALEDVVRELNITLGRSRSVNLELVRWETHTYPGISTDPQAVLNEQLGGSFDIFIGIMWKTFGTPTPRACSGTEEEFNLAFTRHLENPNCHRIMMYFKTENISIDDVDVDQIVKLRKFKSGLAAKGVLYSEFLNCDDFVSRVRVNLAQCVDDWGRSWGENSKYTKSDTSDVVTLNQVELQSADDEGLIDLQELSELEFEKAFFVVERIGDATVNLGSSMGDHNADMEALRLSSTTPDRSEVKRLCNSAAVTIEAYSDFLDKSVVEYSASFFRAVDFQARATALMYQFDMTEEVRTERIGHAVESIDTLVEAIGGASRSVLEMRGSVAALPRMTTQFNRARQHAIRSLDAFLGQMAGSCARLEQLKGSIVSSSGA